MTTTGGVVVFRAMLGVPVAVMRLQDRRPASGAPRAAPPVAQWAPRPDKTLVTVRAKIVRSSQTDQLRT